MHTITWICWQGRLRGVNSVAFCVVVICFSTPMIACLLLGVFLGQVATPLAVATLQDNCLFV